MNKKYINIVENDLTVEVIIGINVSESISPNNQISSLLNPVHILYFALKNCLSSIWNALSPSDFYKISKRYSFSAISRKHLK